MDGGTPVRKGLELRAEALEGSVCKTIAADDAIRMIQNGEGTVWLDVQFTDNDSATWLLRDELGFHELSVEDAVSDRERPSLHAFEGVLFFSATAVGRQEEDEPLEVGIFLSKSSIVTVCKGQSRVIDQWMGVWRQHPNNIGHSPANIAYVILDGIVDDYFPIIEEIEESIDNLMDIALEGQPDLPRRILPIKRRLIVLRRALGPLRDVLNGLLRRDIDHIPGDMRPYFSDVFDHAMRLTELVDTNRELLTSLLDLHLSTTSNSLNEVMKKMTVAATVLMVMALVAGIYGMNFDNMPELHWKYGYAFAWGLMIASAATVLLLFRRFRWI